VKKIKGKRRPEDEALKESRTYGEKSPFDSAVSDVPRFGSGRARREGGRNEEKKKKNSCTEMKGGQALD